MKTQVFLLFVSYVTLPSPGQSASIYPISPFEDLSSIDRSQLAYIREYNRAKRSGSGSGDVLNSLKNSIASGIKSKIGSFAKSSAAASSHFSKSSAGHFSGGSGHFSGHPTYHHHHHEEHDEHEHEFKPFDIWGLKKHIFHTLFQAAKAIKGGVIAIKGQIIKGGGHIISAKGKLLTGGGEAISNIGKSIASSAFMVIPTHHHESHDDHSPEHVEYGPPPSSYGHASGPDVYHNAPSASGAEYGQGHQAQYEGNHHDGVDGIVILKKIPTGPEHTGHTGHGQTDHESYHGPDFKPLSNNVMYSVLPSVKHLVGSMFSASSGSSKENEIDTHSSHETQHDYQHNSEHDQYVQHSQPSVKTQSVANSIHADAPQPKPTATSYGTPVGPTLKYLEYFNKHANAIKNQNQPQMFVTPMPDPHENYQAPNNYPTQNNQLTPTHYPIQINPDNQNNQQNYDLDPTTLTLIAQPDGTQNDNAQIFVGMNLPLNVDHTYEYNTQMPANFLSQHPQSLQDFQRLQDPRNLGSDFKLAPTPYSQSIPTKMIIHYPDPTEVRPPSGPGRHVMLKRPVRTNKLRKKPQNIDIVRSVAFELGPNGPVKL